MNFRRLRTLCVEIYKTLNDFSASFMNNIFKLKINSREVRDKCKLNLDIPKWNQKILDYKSLKVLGPKIWKNLPYHAKSSENLDNSKSLLKNWNGNLCNLCKKWYSLKSIYPSITHLVCFTFILEAFYLISHIQFFFYFKRLFVTKFFWWIQVYFWNFNSLKKF